MKIIFRCCVVIFCFFLTSCIMEWYRTNKSEDWLEANSTWTRDIDLVSTTGCTSFIFEGEQLNSGKKNGETTKTTTTTIKQSTTTTTTTIKQSTTTTINQSYDLAIGSIVYSDGTFSQYYINGKIPLGIAFEITDENHGKMVHLRKSNEMLTWCSDSAEGMKKYFSTNEKNGKFSWQIICDAVTDENTPGKYPAFEYINSLTDGGLVWYMPAYEEMNNIFSNYAKINIALQSLDDAGVRVDLIKVGYYSGGHQYWTSSQYKLASESDVYYIGGLTYWNSKDHSYYVRGVASF